jgi:hypothetical protein
LLHMQQKIVVGHWRLNVRSCRLASQRISYTAALEVVVNPHWSLRHWSEFTFPRQWMSEFRPRKGNYETQSIGSLAR